MPPVTQKFRTDAGGLVDRDAPCRFEFNGETFIGYRGDTVASALLANGVRLAGRSFKYHRPRGIYAIGNDEPNALLQLGLGAYTEPNSRATEIELHDGLVAASQNHWPALNFDLQRINDRLAPLLAAGFYYKTFMWPARFWPFYERQIRRAAGLGRAPRHPDADAYEQRHAHCDVLVVGAGPAGLAAASHAAAMGAEVMLVDEQGAPGGWLCRERAQVNGAAGADWAAQLLGRLSAMNNARVLLRTTAFGYYDHNSLGLVERLADHLAPAQRAAVRQPRQRLWRVRARQVILATGALEQPLVFADNDLPGIMLAGAARGYVNRFGVRPGTRAVVATNNDSAWRTAFDLHDAGVTVVALVDLRGAMDERLRGALDLRGIRLVAGAGVVRARGYSQLRGVEVAPYRDGRWQFAGTESLACDLLCVSGGWAPALHLHAHSGGRNRFDDTLQAFVPDTVKQESRTAGAAAGEWELAGCITAGAGAGVAAAAHCGFDTPVTMEQLRCELPGTGTSVVVPPPPEARGKRFVDLQNDVTVDDVQLAHREGYRSVEHLKRYTTLGMGTDQGRISNLAGLTLLAAARAEPVPAVGTTTYRPPFTPVTLATLAGAARDARLAPVRRTPMHGVHEKAGAVFTGNGLWQRPARFPLHGEKPDATVAREYRAVRTAIGIADISTLGKFELRGRDCLEFLNRAYTNRFDTEQPGRVRYGVLLRDDGLVLDDGAVACLAPGHWLLTCSTSHAEEVREHFEFLLDGVWPELDVHLGAATEQWAAVAVAGPRARAWLTRLVQDTDRDFTALGHRQCATGTVTGLPARFLRVSFSGEYACEIHVPAGSGADLWRRLLAESAGETITPYGLEAMDVLRIEKGYLAGGAEIDGRTCPFDLRLEKFLKRDRRFIGFHGLQRSALQRQDRLQLVGLLAADPKQTLREGAQILTTAEAQGFGAAVGHVTSAAFSPTLGRHVALALVRGGRARMDETVYLADPVRGVRKRQPATITMPVFYDPAGKRFK